MYNMLTIIPIKVSYTSLCQQDGDIESAFKQCAAPVSTEGTRKGILAGRKSCTTSICSWGCPKSKVEG